jgi:hypothetical protein
MKRVPTAVLMALLFAIVFAASGVATRAQSDCGAMNAAKGEGKFTGQISSAPDGSSMQVSYGNQSVLVRYTSATTVCQGGQLTSPDALAQGASVSVFGPMRRNGRNIEIDAARIFVAGPPRGLKFGRQPAGGMPPETQSPQMQPQPQTSAQPGANNSNARTTMPPRFVPPSRSFAPQSNPTNTSSGGGTELKPISMQRSVANSVILRGGTYAETMQRLHVVRKLAVSDLRSRPQMTLGAAQLDFRPVLNNPKALMNVAQRLHTIPQHVQVLEESSEISEVDEGVVIHQVLSYRILPGKCADENAKTELANAGIHCFSRVSTNDRVAEFSRADSPRYIADPGKRQTAIAAFQRNNAAADADASKHIADLRKMLADPTQRAAIVAQVGQAEVARMDSLNDDQLKDEVVNQATQRYEETMFVPKVESSNFAHPQLKLTTTGSPAEMAAVQQILRDGVPEHGGSPANFPKLLKIVPASALHVNGSGAPRGDQSGDIAMGPYYFLTGFTVSNDYEWNWGAQITINWCLVDCGSTYGFNLYAGFNYGFGLRFPIEAQFKYHTVVHPNNTAESSLTSTLEPIQANAQQFLATELDPGQLFDAKELVAQFGANAGFDVNLGVVNANPNFEIGEDFTKWLPAPLTNGVFTPPAPGTGGLNSKFVFNQFDLLDDLLNFGVIGGQVFPEINVNLHSNKLEFTLNDEVLKRQTILNTNTQSVKLGATPIPAGSYSHFSVGNPVYNLGFTLTPGLRPNIWVDLAVWSDSWGFDIWFPQLAVTVPANGIDFSCHAGTTCVIDFAPTYNAATGQTVDMSTSDAAADRTLLGGGCKRVNSNTPGYYLCPVKGMLGLCNAMLKNGAVFSCNALVPDVVNQILTRGKCKGNDGKYTCPQGMMGLCNLYVKNQEILSCTRQ